MTRNIEIDGRQIAGWDSFHDTFAKKLGFSAFYGRNMDAWIDCMSSLDMPDDGLTTVHVETGDVLVLQISTAKDLNARCPEIYDALVECSAFINHRRIKAGEQAILALSF